MIETDSIRNLIRINKKRLAVLEEQRARFGYNTPPHVLMEIDDIQRRIEELSKELTGLKPTDDPVVRGDLDTILVTVLIEGAIERFGREERETFKSALSKFCGTSSDRVRILYAGPGSIILILEMPQVAGQYLLERFLASDDRLHHLKIRGVSFRSLSDDAVDYSAEGNTVRSGIAEVTAKTSLREKLFSKRPPTMANEIAEIEIQDIQAELEQLYTRLAEMENGTQVTTVAPGSPQGASASNPANALTPIQRRHLEQEYSELQRRWDSLSRSIAALDTDISRTLEAFRRQPLEETRAERVTERDQVTRRMAEIEATLGR